MTSRSGKQAIAIHVLSNILRSKGNRTITFGQLIEHNMRNIFLEKSYTKFGGETSPKAFFKKSQLNISLDQESKVLYSLFLLHVQVEGYRNILKLSCRPLAFLKNKKEVWN